MCAELGSADQQVQAARGALYLTVQSLGGNVIAVASFAVLARLISTTDMGILAVLLLMNGASVVFATWFPQAVTKFVAENAASDSMPAAAGAFYQALRANIIIYIPVVGVFYLGAGFMASHLLGSVSYAPMFQVLAFDLFVNNGLNPIVTAALLGLRRFRQLSVVLLIVGGLFRQLLIIGLIILMKNFVGLVYGWLLADTAELAALLVLTLPTLGPPRFDFPMRKLLRYYLPLELGQIVTFAQTYFDRVLLVVFVPLAALGIYNAAVTAIGVLGAVAASISNVLFSSYSSLNAKAKAQSNRSMRDATHWATRYMSFVLTPLGFGLLATAKPALTLFVGDSYIQGSLPLIIFSGGFALAAFTTALGPVFLARGETKIAASITGVSVVIGLMLAYVLLPLWGIVGVSVARASAVALSGVIGIPILKKKMGLQVDFRTVAKTCVAGVTMALVIGAVEWVKYSKFLLPLYVLVGAMMYLLMLRLLKAVDSSDLSLLRRFLGRRLEPLATILTWALLSPNRRT